MMTSLKARSITILAFVLLHSTIAQDQKCISCLDYPEMAPFNTKLIRDEDDGNCFTLMNSMNDNPCTGNVCCGVQSIHSVHIHKNSRCNNAFNGIWSEQNDGAVVAYDDGNKIRIVNAKPGVKYCLSWEEGVDCEANLQAICGDECSYQVIDALGACCPTFTTNLAPPPPPPPDVPTPVIDPTFSFPQGFPFCRCVRNDHSKMSLRYEGNTDTGEICFHLWANNDMECTDSCCELYEIHKIAIHISDSCIGQLSYATVNGQKRSISFDRKPGQAMLKATNLAIAPSAIDSTQICFGGFFKDSCASIEGLCKNDGGFCTYSIFNKNDRIPYCCNVGFTSP